MTTLKFWWLWIKSWFVCQHLSYQLHADILEERLEVTDVDEVWMCSCTCECGQSGIQRQFVFGTAYRIENFTPAGRGMHTRIKSSIH